jgi:hypothetical protein
MKEQMTNLQSVENEVRKNNKNPTSDQHKNKPFI